MHYGVSRVGVRGVSGKRSNVNRPPNHEIIFMKQNFLSIFSSDPPKTLSRASVDPFKNARKETFKNMSTFAIQIKHQENEATRGLNAASRNDIFH